ncbi:MAG: NAD(P)-binding domain-containing protein, partial [bacterium]|nr:NAD(P)-binding domain-containing protein [bacterium]
MHHRNPGQVDRETQAVQYRSVSRHSMEDGMNVGFIGLGTMGSGMAMNTLKGGFDLTVHDVDRDAAGPHLEAGATWADSPREVMETSQVVFSSLPGPPEVE